MNKSTKPRPPQTLMQAHEELVRTRPCPKASLPVWLSYYQHSVKVYEQIATATTLPWWTLAAIESAAGAFESQARDYEAGDTSEEP